VLFGGRVAVDSDEQPVHADATGHEPRVTAAAKGAVDRSLAWLRVEHRDELAG
jgi:hypothetical protein